MHPLLFFDVKYWLNVTAFWGLLFKVYLLFFAGNDWVISTERNAIKPSAEKIRTSAIVEQSIQEAPLLNSQFKTNLRSFGALLHCDFYLLFKKSWIPIYVVNPDWKYPCWSAKSSRLKVWKLNWITSPLILQSSGHRKSA